MTDFSIEPGAAAAALDTVFSQLDRLSFAEALWSRRLDTWTTDRQVQQQIANRLGWLDAIDFSTTHVQQLETFAQSVRASGVTDVVLFGMGGSSLAPEVFHRLFGRPDERPRFRMLDSTDPEAVREALKHAATSLFIVASKSGTTIEPNSMAAAARRRVEADGLKGWASRFVAITDENTDLHRRALNDGFFAIFVNPSDIGGRYSALSLFGLVPAAVIGVPLNTLLDHAHIMADACRRSDSRSNPGLALGAVMAAAGRMGRDKLTLLTPERLEPFGLWVEQLVAESTGKHGKGIVPIVGESPEAPPRDDRVAVVLRVGGVGPDPMTVDRFRAANVPLITIELPGVDVLGAEFVRWEVATAAAGWLMQINPFDEPNVQQAKNATNALLQAYTTKGQLEIREPDARVDDIQFTYSDATRDLIGQAGPDAFLRELTPLDYFALLAYVPPDDPELASTLRDLRNLVSVAHGCPTMLGYGPRYLHSTGQLYKGGANNGVFLVVTAATTLDVAIPDAPYSFGVLEMAQALGDFQSLDRAGRRAVHAHLPDRKPQTFKKLSRILKLS